MSLLPKEHGAYGQMAIPLVTSFVVAGASTPALLIAVALVFSFVAVPVCLAARASVEAADSGMDARGDIRTAVILMVGLGGAR